MIRITILLAFLILTFSPIAYACDCVSGGSFLTVVPKTNFVALIKVTKYLNYKDIGDKEIPTSMEVEIIDIYRGNEVRKNVTVWGDNGILCRPYLSSFDIGKYYVIAFYPGSENSGLTEKNEKAIDYSISICGNFWLDVDINSQIATGAVSDKQNNIKLADIKAKLKGI